jgi:hypothetical protein
MTHGANSQEYGTVRHKKSANMKQQSESQKKSESIKPQVKWEGGWNYQFSIFHIHKLKNTQRQQHNCHTSFLSKEMVNWKTV